jgi:HPt (histidine-containing phosphotransfer) domain-containing protein
MNAMLRLVTDRAEHHACVDPHRAGCERWIVSVIDPDIAGQLAADLPREDFVRILRTFESDLGRLAQELEASVAQGNQDGYRRAAHSLAGAAAAVGATRLERVARIAMDHRNPADPRALAVSVRQEASAALAELAALADNPPGSR